MKPLREVTAIYLMLVLAVAALEINSVQAQGHGVHDASSGNATPLESMPQGMSREEVSQEVRDPHAYSGGYTRTSGPYALPQSQQLRLADETVFTGLWIDRIELREGESEDHSEFAGQAWLGNSYHRLLLRSELEWRDLTFEESMTELLYSRALTPFWNIQLGGRYDHGDLAHRQWLTLGVSGLAPYWFEVNANLYLEPDGHSAATVEVEYETLLSQRLILQPRMGLEFYGDSDLEAGHARGLSKSTLGLRLRYEINRQFAPYFGFEQVHHHGEAKTLFQPLGQHRESHWIAGLRFWF